MSEVRQKILIWIGRLWEDMLRVRSGKQTHFKANHVSNQIFSTDQETNFMNYLIQSSKLNYGLTPIQTRKFVYEYAAVLQKANRNFCYPKYWKENEAASYDWFYATSSSIIIANSTSY